MGAKVGCIEGELKKRPSLTNRVFSHPRTSHKTAVQAMFEADILVNIGNSTSYQLPSKIIEYMATGKPILNLTTIKNDTSSKKLHNYPLHFNWEVHFPNDLNSLCSFIQNSIGTTMPLENVLAYVRESTLSSIADQYLTAILEERR